MTAIEHEGYNSTSIFTFEEEATSVVSLATHISGNTFHTKSGTNLTVLGE
jgi:hypothetical protein